MTKVLFLSQAPGVGGGEHVALSALALVDEIDVVVAAPATVTRYAGELGFDTIDLELPRAHQPMHALRAARGAFRVRALARELGAAVLYANGTRAIPYAIGARAIGGPRLVVHHHGVLSSGSVRTLAWAIDRWADVVIVPSQTSAEPFRRRDKVRVVPNGIDLTRFRPADPDDRAVAKRRWGLQPTEFVVGTITRPDPTKGMEPFLDLAAQVGTTVPGARFLLAGGPVFPHEDEPYRRILDRAGRLGPRVTTTGFLADPLAGYEAIDVFVHLGDPEGFGLTVVEAMACGIPVVAYRWGGVQEVVGDTGLLVTARDVDEAARAVVRLCADSHVRADLAARARARCEDRYGLEEMTQRLRTEIR